MISSPPLDPCGPARRGTVATELALVLPVLVLSVLVCCDFSRVMQHRTVVANAARAAAQQGAMKQFTDYTYADWERRVRACAEEELNCLGTVDPGQALIVPSSYTDDAGYRCVAVDVELPFETVISWGAIPRTIPIHYRAEFRQFR